MKMSDISLTHVPSQAVRFTKWCKKVSFVVNGFYRCSFIKTSAYSHLSSRLRCWAGPRASSCRHSCGWAWCSWCRRCWQWSAAPRCHWQAAPSGAPRPPSRAPASHLVTILGHSLVSGASITNVNRILKIQRCMSICGHLVAHNVCLLYYPWRWIGNWWQLCNKNICHPTDNL